MHLSEENEAGSVQNSGEDLAEMNAELKRQLKASQLQVTRLKIDTEKSTHLLKLFDSKMKDVNQMMEQNNIQKKLYVSSLKKYLIELEEKNRKEKRQWCNEQQIRLGRW